MCHKMLSQQSFLPSRQYKKGHAESAFHDVVPPLGVGGQKDKSHRLSQTGQPWGPKLQGQPSQHRPNYSGSGTCQCGHLCKHTVVPKSCVQLTL